MSKNLGPVYQALFDRFGPQHWWPGDSPWEIAVGAILTQQVAWKNVEKAICALKERRLLDIDAMVGADAETIKELIRPVGFYNQKTARLLDFALYVKNHYGNIEKMLDGETLKVRGELLSLKGIGRETADSILLYAGGHPIFVIDAYTRRFAGCIGIDPDQDYDDLRAVFESGLERNPQLFNEYHALIVRLGKEHCRTKPLCEGCPVFPFRK
ncbi:MAG: hypothetical protein KBC08_06210 [Caldisericia bacterium]|jgi:endonuclease-3 related protein|nr:hypothetical protein [Caldisericia bacterium]